MRNWENGKNGGLWEYGNVGLISGLEIATAGSGRDHNTESHELGDNSSKGLTEIAETDGRQSLSLHDMGWRAMAHWLHNSFISTGRLRIMDI